MNNNFTDGINFISKMRWPKVVNAIKILFSYYYAKLSGKPALKGMPMSISIEPTTSCNLRCPECPSGLRSFSRPTGMMEAKQYENIIQQLEDKLLYLLFYFQGEPYLHPQFTEMVKYAADKGIYTATSTNAHFLNDEMAKKTVESGLDRLIISIDGTTQETYESYRIGGKLEKVLEGTKNIIKWKKKLGSKTPHVIFQFLVVKPNQHQIEEVKVLAKSLGVNEVGLKTAQIYDYKNGSDLMPTVDKYSRYRKNANGNYEVKAGTANSCWKMWHSCVITWDGQVVPCCFDKDAEHALGQLQHTSFKDVWQGEAYTSFRQKLLQSRDQIEMCQNCTEGTKVWG